MKGMNEVFPKPIINMIAKSNVRLFQDLNIFDLNIYYLYLMLLYFSS